MALPLIVIPAERQREPESMIANVPVSTLRSGRIARLIPGLRFARAGE
jgi:hypothetical protein